MWADLQPVVVGVRHKHLPILQGSHCQRVLQQCARALAIPVPEFEQVVREDWVAPHMRLHSQVKCLSPHFD